jgi:hypothetical protein
VEVVHDPTPLPIPPPTADTHVETKWSLGKLQAMLLSRKHCQGFFWGMSRVERSILVEASAEAATSQINSIAIMQNLN